MSKNKDVYDYIQEVSEIFDEVVSNCSNGDVQRFITCIEDMLQDIID